MSLLITDSDVSFDGANTPHVSPRVVGQTVTATALTLPLYIATGGGAYAEDEQQGLRTVTPNATTGVWSLTLPWPSETRVATQWSIKRTSGNQITGTVPEGVVGPVSVDSLIFSHAWVETLPT